MIFIENLSYFRVLRATRSGVQEYQMKFPGNPCLVPISVILSICQGIGRSEYSLAPPVTVAKSGRVAWRRTTTFGHWASTF